MKKILIFIFYIILCLNVFSENRGLKFSIEKEISKSDKGKYWLVLIAINDYKYWNSLNNPVNDAKNLKKVLENKYYFTNTIELYNQSANKAGILKLFKKLVNEVEADDSILIFYAGHGHLDFLNTASWIPQDGGLDDERQDNWLPNSQVKNLLTSLNAKHIALIADSCFSGDILEQSRGQITNEYIEKAFDRRSVQIMTSGAKETVPDKSEFTKNLILTLENNKNAYIDFLSLYNEIKLGVRKTIPLFGDLKESSYQQGGSFIFFKKEDNIINKEINLSLEKNYASLNIFSDRTGNLYINNNFIAVIPANHSLKIEKISVGDYEIKFNSGSDSKTQSLRIDKNTVNNINFKEKKKYGKIEIISDKDAEIYLDDKFIGNIIKNSTMKLDNVQTGIYSVKLKYADKILAKTVHVEENKINELYFKYFPDSKEDKKKNYFKYLIIILALILGILIYKILGKKKKIEEKPIETKEEKEIIPKNIKPSMIKIEKGSFIMGDDSSSDLSEKPAHEVNITYDFFIGRFLITQAEYEFLLNYNPSKFKKGRKPVESVSYKDATEYCNLLSKSENLAKAYNSFGELIDKNGNKTSDLSKIEGYRLPSEAEWEYVASGGKYTHNFEYSGNNDINKVAWYKENSNLETKVVGYKEANELGIYDMSGNLWEWCQDLYDVNFYVNSPRENPLSLKGEARVIKGGSWFSNEIENKIRKKAFTFENNVSDTIGFRIVRTKI